MGQWLSSSSPPPPPGELKVLLPPLFDFPSKGSRTSMYESCYNMFFGKMALRDLFSNYFEGVGRFSTQMRMLDLDSLARFVFDVAGPLDQNSEEGIAGNAEFRLSSIDDNIEAEVDVCVSNTKPTLLIRSSIYWRKHGFGAFWKSSPLFKNERLFAAPNDGIVGFIYVEKYYVTGATVNTNTCKVFPQNAWFVGKIGGLTAGVQYEPKFESKGIAPQKNFENWSCAISYGRDTDKFCTPSYNFALQLANNSQFIASFYQHMVFERRVINPFRRKNEVHITNYIDFGVELQTTMEAYKNKIRDYTFQVAASWQANKNILVKAKVGPLTSSIALVFKTWWKPSLKFNILALRDRAKRETSFGFGFEVESNPKKRYELAPPKYAVSYSPNMSGSVDGLIHLIHLINKCDGN